MEALVLPVINLIDRIQVLIRHQMVAWEILTLKALHLPVAYLISEKMFKAYKLSITWEKEMILIVKWLIHLLSLQLAKSQWLHLLLLQPLQHRRRLSLKRRLWFLLLVFPSHLIILFQLLKLSLIRIVLVIVPLRILQTIDTILNTIVIGSMTRDLNLGLALRKIVLGILINKTAHGLV